MVLFPWLATSRLPAELNAMATGPFSPVSDALGFVAPGTNSLTVVPTEPALALATYKLPCESKANAAGWVPEGRPLNVAFGLVVAGAILLTVSLPALDTNRFPLASKARALGFISPVSVPVGVTLPGWNTLT